VDNHTLAVLLPLGFIVLLIIGVPVGVALAASGLLFGYLGFGMNLLHLLPLRVYGVTTNYTLMAVPLFVFMGVMLERSRLAEDLLEVIGLAAGGLRGGMGLSIILVGVLMGASTGIVGATVVTLGLLTLPVFIRRGYSKQLACGTICAAGTLGQIIPPSLVLILLADITGESVGTLFAAAFIPGLVLAGVFAIYMLLIGWLAPHMAPAIPAAERAEISGGQLFLRICKVVMPPFMLIVAVLGSIIGGIAAPTEAASMGALGALVLATVSRRLTRTVLIDTMQSTLKISVMVFFILICSRAFALSFRGLNGDELINALFEWIPGGVIADLIALNVMMFILGFFMEWIEITYIVLPLFLPIFVREHVDMVWLAMLVCLNLQTSFLTPPVGWSLFFLKGVAPPEVTTRDIYLGVVPFILLQLIALVILFVFPDVATWLPRAIGWI
jgi:tripartite ATP-independent transporter DctM subunit